MRPVLPIVCLKVPNGYPKDTISYPKVPIAFPKVSVAYLKVSFLHAVAFSPRDCRSWVSTCSAVYDCQLLYYPNLTDLPMAVYSTGRSAAFGCVFPCALWTLTWSFSHWWCVTLTWQTKPPLYAYMVWDILLGTGVANFLSKWFNFLCRTLKPSNMSVQ